MRDATLPTFDALTFQTATTALAEGCAAIRAGQAVIDLGGVKTVDSSGVAVLLAWQRMARKAGTTLSYINVPASLTSLVNLYDVDSLLHHH
ncbi:MAG: STAS domain-containing protein [Pseudomonadota bacterium]